MIVFDEYLVVLGLRVADGSYTSEDVLKWINSHK